MSLKRYMVCFQIFLKTRRIIQHAIKNKVLSALCLLCICSVIFPFSFNKIHQTLEDNFLVCNGSASVDWKDIFVPGQIRSARIRTNNDFYGLSELKTILLWTKYFSEEYSNDFYFFQSGYQTFKRYNCEFSDCFITSNRSLLETVDAVLFHATDLKFSDLPKRPNPEQIWILYSMEPPKYLTLRWKVIQSVFNWTMTYRSDSDVQVKYGEVVERNESCLPSPIRHRKSFQRSKGAIWMVSNCRTESRREAYVKELKQYFSVDTYGKCSRRRRCEPPQSSSCYRLLDDYKYYLSFENSICKDYVTEKFFNVLQYDIVPVVFGGGDYLNIAPNNSFIDATRFNSPKKLAEYLTEIADNYLLYDRFFEWKYHYSVHLHTWMCDLCKLLHEPLSKPQTLPKHFWYWWVPTAMCQRWHKRKGFKSLF